MRAASPTVRLYCNGLHPDNLRAGEKCGSILGDVPGALQLTFAGLYARAPEEPDGMVWLKCPRKTCGAWNRYRLLERRRHR